MLVLLLFSNILFSSSSIVNKESKTKDSSTKIEGIFVTL